MTGRISFLSLVIGGSRTRPVGSCEGRQPVTDQILFLSLVISGSRVKLVFGVLSCEGSRSEMYDVCGRSFEKKLDPPTTAN